MAAVVDRTLRSGPVDIVVNNAGYAVVGAAEEMTVEQVRDQIEVLLLAPMLITRAFLPSMREQGGGRIIQISSMGGQVAIPTHSAYHAGKWGLEGFSESVGREVADFGIHVTLVEPGGTRTGFASALRYTEETAAYRDNVVGRTRRRLEATGDDVLTGDPAKLAAVIYRTTRDPNPPLRLDPRVRHLSRRPHGTERTPHRPRSPEGPRGDGRLHRVTRLRQARRHFTGTGGASRRAPVAVDAVRQRGRHVLVRCAQPDGADLVQQPAVLLG